MSRMMAKAKLDSSTAVSKDETRTCMLCSETYEDPVVMECGHSFCCSCINKSCASPDSLSCPDCNKVIMEKKPITNLVSESMANPTASAAPVTASAARTVKKCPEHDEILKMYCEDDDSLCCTICQDSIKHSGHTFLNVVDAMKVCQAKLSNAVSPLEETLKKIENDDLSTQQSEQKERLQNSMTDCRQHITSEFGNLYKFLEERKEKLLGQLKEKKQRLLKEMESNAAKMAEKRDPLREAIAVANEKTMDTDPCSFLDGIKDVLKTCRKQNESSSTFTITEEELCRATFRGPIQYITWMQMKSIVPAPTLERPHDQSCEREPEDGGEMHGDTERTTELGDSTVSATAQIGGQNENAPTSERPRDQSCDREPEDGGQTRGDWEWSFESAPMSERPCDQSCDREPEDGGQTHGAWEWSFESAPTSERPRDQSCDREPEDGGQTHGDWERSFKSGDSTVSATAHIGGQKDKDKVLERPRCPQRIHSSGFKEIWLVGTCYLNAVRNVANRHPLGFNMGFHQSSCTVRWFMLVNASCKDLFKSIRIWSKSYGSPDVLFFYLDSSDMELTHDNFNRLLDTIQKDLIKATVRFPNTEFILSALYPNADKLQNHFYSSFAKFAQRPRFSFFRFTELEKMMKVRGKEANLKNLTSTELDLFFTTMRDALQDAVNKPFQPVVPIQHCQTVVEKCEEIAMADDGDNPVPTEPKLIWIVGNGFMDSARHRAESSSLGLNLGFEKQICTILWKNADYTWFSLFTHLKQMSQNERKPDVLLLHCGDSDLAQATEKSLILNVQCCINGAANFYPLTEFVLSQLVPTPQKWTPDLESCRKELNYWFTEVVQRTYFNLLRHYDLEKTLIERFSKGCISEPTDAEIDLFLSDIRSCLQETIFQDYKPSDNGTLPSGDKQNEGTAIVPAGPSITRRKEIWIFGCGFMMAANYRAETGPLGFNLGFDTQTCMIHWWRLKNSTQFQVLSNYSKRADIVLIYMGNLDVEKQELNITKKKFEEIFGNFEKFHPNAEFIISTLLPKSKWPGTNAQRRLREFNSFLAGYVEKPCFHLLRLDEMEEFLLKKYATGNNGSLNAAETDLFIAKIRDALLKAMNKDYMPSIANCETLLSGDAPSEKAQLQGPVKELPSSAMEVDAAVKESKVIWIVGSGFVDSARQHAESRAHSLGLNLGFEKQICTIMWKNYADYNWFNLYNYLKQMSQNARKPDVLLLHCGDSDLGQGTENSLNVNVQRCLNRAAILYPRTEFVLSQLVPNPQKWTHLEPCRKELNYRFTQVVQRPRFHLLRHYDLEKTLTERFSKGCISVPTDAELDLFLSDIRSYLQDTIFQAYKPSDNGTLPSGDKQSDGTAIVPDGLTAGLSITRRKEIWIFGCGFMTAANHRAETGPLGFNLGFDTQTCMIHWWQLEDLNPNFLSNYFKRVDIVLIYMGNLDVEKQELNTIKMKCEGIFDNIEKFYPNAEFIISTLLPKSKCLGANAERRRKGFKSFLTGYVEKPRFHLLRLDEIEESLFNRHTTESDCCLDAAETDLFIVRIRDALLKAMNKDYMPSIANCETLPSGDAPSEKAQLQGPVKEMPSTLEVDAAVKGAKQIWVVGNSFISRAERQAKICSYGSNFGFEKGKWVILWMGHVGMRWEALVPELTTALFMMGPPSIAFIHLGDNDLGNKPHDALMKAMKDDLTQISKEFPNTEFVFSTILPRAEWLTNGVEEQRQEINATLMEYAADVGFHVAVHEDIEETAIPRFKSGGSGTISGSEFDLFLKGIKDAMEVMIQKVENPQTDEFVS